MCSIMLNASATPPGTTRPLAMSALWIREDRPSGLGVWSRDEVTRINFEDFRAFGPSKADCFEGRSPFQCLEMLGKVIG